MLNNSTRAAVALALAAAPLLCGGAITRSSYELNFRHDLAVVGTVFTNDNDIDSSSAGQAVVFDQTVTVGSAIGRAQVRSAVGTLSTSLFGHAETTGVPGWDVGELVDPRAIAYFGDNVYFVAADPAQAGQRVTVQAQLLLDGHMTLAAVIPSTRHNAYAQLARLDITGTGVPSSGIGSPCPSGAEGCGLTGIAGYVIEPNSVIPLQFEVFLSEGVGAGNTPTFLQYSLELAGRALAFADDTECSDGCETTFAELTADYAQTLRWGGITQAVDLLGQSVALSMAIGDTGLDYLAPLPWPAAGWLMAAGLALVTRQTRTRRA